MNLTIITPRELQAIVKVAFDLLFDFNQKGLNCSQSVTINHFIVSTGSFFFEFYRVKNTFLPILW